MAICTEKELPSNIPYAYIFIAASALNEELVLLHTDSHFDTAVKYTVLKVESLVSILKIRDMIGKLDIPAIFKLIP